MSDHIGRLCDELRIKLHGMDRRLEAIKANGLATFDRSQGMIEGQLDRVEQRIYDNRANVKAANRRVEDWLLQRKAGIAGGGKSWNERRTAGPSGSPADDAEAYALASFELATAAVDEAILAALQAVLARGDVEKAAGEPVKGPGVVA
ncbi:MAG: hypothetical protein ABW026_06170 [Microvirga sp.]